ncbi:cysteine-rich receptor-like protein kinase 25 [Olea europaea var. sylvestris]|uniref:cysteine-rich receptor-like protein kinase 25 n=1 Tax=Olea europaea var. sylvestris TaxID=158386 RepID=UPI000C1D4650|nr:cysteine-rich receptor-like protein kinase 25 [Olea europaea var. sylvestris]
MLGIYVPAGCCGPSSQYRLWSSKYSSFTFEIDRTMYTVMSSRKWLPNLIILVCLVNLVAIVKSQFPTPIYFHFKCQNNGSYTSNSKYQTNLDTLLSSVSPNISANGFYNASLGENSGRVNTVALCRADLQPYQCRDYVKNATAEILKKCPFQKQAILWHEFCMVRYSNEAILGHVSYSPFEWGHSMENVPHEDEFYREVNILLDSVRNQTASNRSSKKFAAASRDYPDYRTIYAFEQCTPDITPKDCDDCLNQSALEIRRCCNGARGVRILRPSCYLRLETDPFYNETMVYPVLQSPTPPALVPKPQILAPPGNDDNTTRTIIIIIGSIVVVLILGLCIGIVLRMRRKSKPQEQQETDHEISTAESLYYDFGTIRAATDNFSDANVLGKGGFGIVFRGKLPNRQEIAVKRLSMNSTQGDLEFKNEILLVARLQHRNLVRILGFSLEGSERLLIYEFLENGSLDRFLFDPTKRQYLNWDTRYKIIGGVARGVLYLHEDSRLRIIHRDLKASNVLLDGEMNPKISDFGMARLFDKDETQSNTSRVVGTYGYMAPEYAIAGKFSSKSDVFSFGVLVLEIITGQKISNFQCGENDMDLLSCVWKNWHEGTATNIIDPALRTSAGSLPDIIRCVHIGLLCVQENASDRPTMAAIVLMVTSSSITLSIPSQPTFLMSRSFDPKNSLLQEHNSRSSETAKSSRNRSGNSTQSFSMSDLDPR